MGGYTPEALAKYWAESVVHDAGLGLASEAASNAASVLLGLLGTSDDISLAAAYRDQRDRAVKALRLARPYVENPTPPDRAVLAQIDAALSGQEGRR